MVLPEQFNVLSLTLTQGEMQPGIAQQASEERNKDLCLALLRSLHQPVSTQRAAQRGSDTSLLLDTLTGVTNCRAELSRTVIVICVVIQAPSGVL